MHQIKILITLEVRQQADGQEKWEPLPTAEVEPGTVSEVIGANGKPFARVHVHEVKII